MSFATLEGILASSVANAGTFSGSYPSGTNRGDFVNGVEHKLLVNQTLYSAPESFTIAFGATTWTLTWNGGYTLAASSSYRLQLDKPGESAELVDADGATVLNTVPLTPVWIDLGNPITADVDGICAVELLGAAGDMTIGGAAASGGVATLDVPRNVTLTVATTNQSGITFTVYGTDAYGNELIESRAGPNANTVALAKAFKTVTRVAASAAVATNGVSVGFGDVLGLPIHLPVTSLVLKQLEDSAAATDGTLVAGLSALTKPTISNADVRGTYDPNSACDGSKSFQLLVAVPDPTFKGQAQYAG